jgi:tRNA(Glu) U13 pseudouridine synthase TruD
MDRTGQSPKSRRVVLQAAGLGAAMALLAPALSRQSGVKAARQGDDERWETGRCNNHLRRRPRGRSYARACIQSIQTGRGFKSFSSFFSVAISVGTGRASN